MLKSVALNIRVINKICAVLVRTGDFIEYLDNRDVGRLGRICAIIVDDNQKYHLKVQPVLRAGEASMNFQSTEPTLDNEVWLVECALSLIHPSRVLRKVTIWLTDLVKPPQYEYKATTILYRFQGHPQTRPLSKHHLHPSEYVLECTRPPDIPELKIFIKLYYDDFGSHRNVYHKLGGVYFQLGNFPRSVRSMLCNHFVLGFVPFGGTFDDFIRPFLEDVQKLQDGFEMTIHEKKYWISGGLGVTTGDLPQGNDLAGVMRQNAKHGCRVCLAERNNWTNENINTAALGRYLYLTNQQFDEITSTLRKSHKEEVARMYGLRVQRPILDKLWRDRTLQCAFDVYHAISGIIGRLLDCTLNSFASSTHGKLLSFWKSFEVPHNWHKLPNPIIHRRHFTMSDNLRLAMILPFILHRFLTPRGIKTDSLYQLKEHLGCQTDYDVVNSIIKCWKCVSCMAAAAFQPVVHGNVGYSKLEQYFCAARNSLVQVGLHFISIYSKVQH
jgi:hypothetical protein